MKGKVLQGTESKIRVSRKGLQRRDHSFPTFLNLPAATTFISSVYLLINIYVFRRFCPSGQKLL